MSLEKLRKHYMLLTLFNNKRIDTIAEITSIIYVDKGNPFNKKYSPEPMEPESLRKIVSTRIRELIQLQLVQKPGASFPGGYTLTGEGHNQLRNLNLTVQDVEASLLEHLRGKFKKFADNEYHVDPGLLHDSNTAGIRVLSRFNSSILQTDNSALLQTEQ